MLKNKVAIIYGASGGIGGAVARAFAREGAKVFAADVAFKIAFNGMQLLGGYAQLPEYDMERYFREAKHAMVGGGTNEIQKSIIAKELGL